MQDGASMHSSKRFLVAAAAVLMIAAQSKDKIPPREYINRVGLKISNRTGLFWDGIG